MRTLTLLAPALALALFACTGGSGDGDGSCNDGVLGTNEECEGFELRNETCVSRGFTGGTLACTDSCTLDTSGCTTGSFSVRMEGESEDACADEDASACVDTESSEGCCVTSQTTENEAILNGEIVNTGEADITAFQIKVDPSDSGHTFTIDLGSISGGADGNFYSIAETIPAGGSLPFELYYFSSVSGHGVFPITIREVGRPANSYTFTVGVHIEQ